jgi:hypothetical protein
MFGVCAQACPLAANKQAVSQPNPEHWTLTVRGRASCCSAASSVISDQLTPRGSGARLGPAALLLLLALDLALLLLLLLVSVLMAPSAAAAAAAGLGASSPCVQKMQQQMAGGSIQCVPQPGVY